MSVRYPLLLLSVIVAGSALAPTGNALAQGHGRDGATAPSPPLLGAVEIASNNLAALPQWTRILDKIGDEKKAMERCDVSVDACTSAEIVTWRARLILRTATMSSCISIWQPIR